MINDLPTHSVIPSKKSNCSGYPLFSSHLVFSLRKVEAKSLEMFCQDFKGPHFPIAKNWQNLGSVAEFLMKFALFDERNMALLAAKSFGT